eukprot:345038_1
MKDNKSTGPNNTPIEIYKMNNTLQIELKNIIYKIWINVEFPDNWGDGDTLMFYKKDNINIYGNYRALTMLNHEFKVFSRMLLLDIKDDIEIYLKQDEHGDMQQGFRPYRSTRDNLLILRWIITLILENDQDKLALFIDFKGAFPSMAHNQIIYSLIDAKIKSKNIKLIILIFKEARIRYKLDNMNYGKWIAVCRGLIQGDVVNPLLFCTAAYYIIKKYKLFNNYIKIQIKNDFAIEKEIIDPNTIASHQSLPLHLMPNIDPFSHSFRTVNDNNIIRQINSIDYNDYNITEIIPETEVKLNIENINKEIKQYYNIHQENDIIINDFKTNEKRQTNHSIYYHNENDMIMIKENDIMINEIDIMINNNNKINITKLVPETKEMKSETFLGNSEIFLGNIEPFAGNTATLQTHLNEPQITNTNLLNTQESGINVKVKDMYFVDDLGVLENSHKSSKNDLDKLDESLSDDTGLIIHPKKTEILVISKKTYKVTETNENDCDEMKWSVKCNICKRSFPNNASLPGHKAWCKKDNPYPTGSRRGTLADKIIKNNKIEKILNEVLPVIEYKGNKIMNKFSVKYLGSIFTMNGDITIEIRRRIGMASGQFRVYFNIFNDKKLNIEIKMRFYDALILSIALFGCESWPNIKKHSKIISRMITGHKSIIKDNKNQNNFENMWKYEDKLLLNKIKERKLKYLRIIFSNNGCEKVK